MPSSGQGVTRYFWSSTWPSCTDYQRWPFKWWGVQFRQLHPLEVEFGMVFCVIPKIMNFTILLLSLLVVGVTGHKGSFEQRMKNIWKIWEKLVLARTKMSTLRVVSVIHFLQISRLQSLNGKNKATEVLTLKMSCGFVFFLSHPSMSHHQQSSFCRQWNLNNQHYYVKWKLK